MAERIRVESSLSWINVVLLVVGVCAAFRACGDESTMVEEVGAIVGETVRAFNVGYERTTENGKEGGE